MTATLPWFVRVLAAWGPQQKFRNGAMFVCLNFITVEPYEIFLTAKVFQTTVIAINSYTKLAFGKISAIM